MTTPVKFSDLPALPALDDADEIAVFDADAATPQTAVARATIAALKAFIGSDSSDWSTHPATQDVDMAGHDVVGLPVYDPAVDPPPSDMSAAVSALTMNNAFNYLLPRWASYKASEDVDMDGHRITGLGEPVDPDDAARLTEVTDALQDAKNYTDSELASYVPPPPFSPNYGWARMWRSREGVANGFPNQSNYILDSEEYALLKVGDLCVSGDASGGWGGSVRVCTNKGSLGTGGASWHIAFPWNDSGSFFRCDGKRLSYLADPTTAVDAATKGYVDGWRALAEWWTPAWTPVSNVDSVSNVECQYTRVRRAAGGSLVTLEGTITVEIDEDDESTILSAPLPVPATSTGTLLAPATGVDISRGDRAVCGAVITDMGSGPVLVIDAGVLANATGVPATLTIGFRVSYRAA